MRSLDNKMRCRDWSTKTEMRHFLSGFDCSLFDMGSAKLVQRFGKQQPRLVMLLGEVASKLDTPVHGPLSVLFL